MSVMLEEEAPGDVVVLYRVRSEADVVLLNEVRHVVALRGGRLHLLTGRTGEGGTAPFGPGSLHRLVPDVQTCAYRPATGRAVPVAHAKRPRTRSPGPKRTPLWGRNPRSVA
ncbi:hypothetical protein SGFS_052970 [Streptomyces graminofaciens]|uniref:Uncharacterized protein n=1 Tax=Streptomyces graminofaciens TaxID=68212 RepID=A0ABN5VNK4_9ACTN|nr:hypothetical protein SGFS_052970 [Streptomyces graminofaciens]